MQNMIQFVAGIIAPRFLASFDVCRGGRCVCMSGSHQRGTSPHNHGGLPPHMGPGHSSSGSHLVLPMTPSAPEMSRESSGSSLASAALSHLLGPPNGWQPCDCGCGRGKLIPLKYINSFHNSGNKNGVRMKPSMRKDNGSPSGHESWCTCEHSYSEPSLSLKRSIASLKSLIITVKGDDVPSAKSALITRVVTQQLLKDFDVPTPVSPRVNAESRIWEISSKSQQQEDEVMGLRKIRLNPETHGGRGPPFTLTGKAPTGGTRLGVSEMSRISTSRNRLNEMTDDDISIVATTNTQPRFNFGSVEMSQAFIAGTKSLVNPDSGLNRFYLGPVPPPEFKQEAMEMEEDLRTSFDNDDNEFCDYTALPTTEGDAPYQDIQPRVTTASGSGGTLKLSDSMNEVLNRPDIVEYFDSAKAKLESLQGTNDPVIPVPVSVTVDDFSTSNFISPIAPAPLSGGGIPSANPVQYPTNTNHRSSQPVSTIMFNVAPMPQSQQRLSPGTTNISPSTPGSGWSLATGSVELNAPVLLQQNNHQQQQQQQLISNHQAEAAQQRQMPTTSAPGGGRVGFWIDTNNIMSPVVNSIGDTPPRTQGLLGVLPGQGPMLASSGNLTPSPTRLQSQSHSGASSTSGSPRRYDGSSATGHFDPMNTSWLPGSSPLGLPIPAPTSVGFRFQGPAQLVQPGISMITTMGLPAAAAGQSALRQSTVSFPQPPGHPNHFVAPNILKMEYPPSTTTAQTPAASAVNLLFRKV